MTEPLNLTDEQQRALVKFALRALEWSQNPGTVMLGVRITAAAQGYGLMSLNDQDRIEIDDWLKDAANDQDHA